MMIRKFIQRTRLFFSGPTSFKKFIPGIIWFIVLLGLLCIPGRELPETGDWLQKIYFDKWIHAGLFGLLAFLFIAPVYAMGLSNINKWLYVIAVTILVSTWGLLTEFIQHYLVSGRSFDLLDWLADTTGAIISIFVTRYYLYQPGTPGK